MHIELNEKKDGEQHITVTLSPEEMQPHLVTAAKAISETREFKGFRKGNVPFDVVEREVGAMTLLEGAIRPAIEASLTKALDQHEIDGVAQPRIEVKTVAPGNPLVYTAAIPLLPKTTLPDFSGITVAKKDVAVEDKHIDKVLSELQNMRTQEKLVLRKAGMGDRVKTDLHLSIANVPLEGGAVAGHQFVLGADAIIPGLSEQVVGMAAGEERTFTLPFPTEFHDKNLAGKEVTFKVKISEVHERTLPEVNDEFAKGVGKFEGIADLKAKIKENLTLEGESKEIARQEQELLSAAIEKTTFDPIPAALIDLEIDRMMEELKASVASQNISFEEYLKHLNKDEAALKSGMREAAHRRVKVALMLRDIAAAQDIAVTDEDVEQEIAKRYGDSRDQPQVAEMVESDRFKTYLKSVMRTDKALAWLKEKAGIISNG
ncbi:MAG: trigger factor [bacterium]|nr:trigger factor [bacterium]